MAKVNGLRYPHRRRRTRLQSRHTRSAEWLLNRRELNHIISKRIAPRPLARSRIAVEDLQGVMLRGHRLRVAANE